MLQNISPSIRFWRRFLTLKLSSFIYLLHFLSRKVCWEDAFAPEGYGKERTDQEKGMQWTLETHRHVIEILTFLTAPGFPSALCQGHDYGISACALPAAECSNFVTISGLFFFHCIMMAPEQRFLGARASRGWEPQLRWTGSCSIQVKWNWAYL